MAVERKSWPPFVPKVLDDAGLPPTEFRIVCRVGRRGDCYETLGEMARGCRMHRDTVIAALGRLVEWSVVIKKSRTGTTSVYTLNHPEEWRLPIGIQGATLGEDKGRVDPTETEGRHPTETKGRKGNPLKAVGEIEDENETFRQDGEPQEEIAVPTHRFQSLKPK